MVRSRNRTTRRVNRRFPIRGRGGMRGTRNRKVVVLHRRPRRNVPKRIPVLGYAAGGTCTTFRSCIKEYVVTKTTDTLSDVYKFTLSDALSKSVSALKLITSIYTNFQIQRVTFRVLSTVGSTTGGISCGWVIDDSMGFPSTSGIDITDVISRGGSTCGKIWQDIALEWVPTEPEDLNYAGATNEGLGFAYVCKLASAVTEDTVVGLLVADIHVVARTINPSTSSAIDVLRLDCSRSEGRAAHDIVENEINALASDPSPNH